jgi:Anti-sigma factor NepR
MSSQVSNGDSHQVVTRKVGDEVRAHIGERLKAHYDAVLKEPIPDRFMQLLARLEIEDPQSNGQLIDDKVHEDLDR